MITIFLEEEAGNFGGGGSLYPSNTLNRTLPELYLLINIENLTELQFKVNVMAIIEHKRDTGRVATAASSTALPEKSIGRR